MVAASLFTRPPLTQTVGQILMKKLELHHVEIKHKKNIAVYVDVFLQNENGEVYKLHTAMFEHELEICPTLRAVDPPSALVGGRDSENSAGN